MGAGVETTAAGRVPAWTQPLQLRGVRFSPALFLAPMAGVTHSAFRRLVADFGGYGALYTEMLCATCVTREDLVWSPWLKRRPHEGRVIYQLLAAETGPAREAVARLVSECGPDGLDLNGACPAPTVRKRRGGADLFEDAGRLQAVVRQIRAGFQGPFTVKIRLGQNRPGWRETLGDRLRLLKGEGVDAVTVHPRFADEALRRSARHALLADLADEAGLPLIASGDILGPDLPPTQAVHLAGVAGLMIGRMAAVRPWVFASWHNPALTIDPADVWNRFADYVREDFVKAGQALARVKIFTAYYARNFAFGHTLFAGVQSAPDLETARRRAREFFAGAPVLCRAPSMTGI